MSTASSRSESDEFEPEEDLCLPQEMRKELSRQYQPLVTSEAVASKSEHSAIVAVGDMVCYTLVSSGVIPKISVFDFKTERRRVPDAWADALLSIPGAQLNVRSPPGCLSLEMWNALRLAWEFPGRTKMIVDGEEDLAGLASIYMMKGALVVYGLPGIGMTAVESNEDSRRTAYSILAAMIPVSRMR
jgi:uncharacterized protein (UPF0218 family)